MVNRFNDGTDYKLPHMTSGRRLVKVYEYWTNFSRDNNEQYDVLKYNPELPDYWWFKTNLDENDLMVFMTSREQQSFLYKMLREYKG